MHNLEDTICAQATPPGEGGIAILRMSGPRAGEILGKVFLPAGGALVPRMLTYGRVMDSGKTADEAMAVLMPGPRSYTRQDVAEICCGTAPGLPSPASLPTAPSRWGASTSPRRKPSCA